MSLDHLFDRNVAWVQAKTRDDPNFFSRMAGQQLPRLMWIGCSDSRVTANDVLGLDPGEVFVQRNIANVVHTSDMNLLAVMEYAIDILKGTSKNSMPLGPVRVCCPDGMILGD